MTWNQIEVLLVHAALFLGSVAAMLGWQKRQRRRRLPSGETRLRGVREFDEDAVRWMALAAAFPRRWDCCSRLARSGCRRTADLKGRISRG